MESNVVGAETSDKPRTERIPDARRGCNQVNVQYNCDEQGLNNVMTVTVAYLARRQHERRDFARLARLR